MFVSCVCLSEIRRKLLFFKRFVTRLSSAEGNLVKLTNGRQPSSWNLIRQPMKSLPLRSHSKSSWDLREGEMLWLWVF